LPYLIEVSHASSSVFGYPSPQKLPVKSGFVVANLFGSDVFFVQKLGNSLKRISIDLARDIDSMPTETEVTVRLRQRRESKSLEDGPDAGRVSLVHLVDSNDQCDVHTLFSG
jgi:hypothetical protein